MHPQQQNFLHPTFNRDTVKVKKILHVLPSQYLAKQTWVEWIP